MAEGRQLKNSRMGEKFTEPGNRLRETRRVLGFQTQEAFGEALGGFSLKQVSNAERGQNPIPVEMIRALVEKFDVNINWLLAGKGYMFIGPMPARSEQEGAIRQHELAEAAARPAATEPPPPRIIPKEDVEALKPAVRGEYVPILAATAAGPPSLEGDRDEPVGWADEFVHVPGAVPGCFALRVSGASMAPEYPSGCLVLVGGPISLGAAEVPAVAFLDEGRGDVGHTFKMVRAAHGRVTLRPLNEHYRAEDVPPKRLIKVLGVLARIG